METAQPNTHFRIVGRSVPPQGQRAQGWTYFTQMELGIHLFICDVQIAVFKTLRLNVPPCLPLSDREMREVLAKNTPITVQLHRAARKFTLTGREFGRRGFPAWLFHSGLVDMHDPVFGLQPNTYSRSVSPPNHCTVSNFGLAICCDIR
jgi:hypothetical protein